MPSADISLRDFVFACTISLGPTAGSGHVRIATITLLGVLLIGCAPKPLPDWVVARQVERTLPRVKAARIVVREAPDRGPPSHVTFTQSATEVLPFTPEWQAREDAFDQRLRRTMNICRGC